MSAFVSKQQQQQQKQKQNQQRRRPTSQSIVILIISVFIVTLTLIVKQRTNYYASVLVEDEDEVIIDEKTTYAEDAAVVLSHNDPTTTIIQKIDSNNRTILIDSARKRNRKMFYLRPDERSNVPGKYLPERAQRQPFKLPPVAISRTIARALEETGRGQTKPCKCVRAKEQAIYHLEEEEEEGKRNEHEHEEIVTTTLGTEEDGEEDDKEEEKDDKEGDEEDDKSDEADDEDDDSTTTKTTTKTTTSAARVVRNNNNSTRKAKLTFAIFHVATAGSEITKEQFNRISMVLQSVVNKHDKCRLVILTDEKTDFTPLIEKFPEIELRRHKFGPHIEKGWTTYLRATAEKQLIFDEIEKKPQRKRDNIVFMDSTDIIFAKSIKNVFRDEQTKIPHLFGMAWTYRDGSNGANKKWPINFGVRFVNAERIAEAALISAYFVHAYEFFFYTEIPNMRAESSQFFWEQDVANWLAKRFKRFKDRKAGDRGKAVDASMPIRYIIEGDEEGEGEGEEQQSSGFLCRHVSMRFMPCSWYNANPPREFPVKRFDVGRQNIGCPATSKSSIFHMKGSLKSKMEQVYDWVGKVDSTNNNNNQQQQQKPPPRARKTQTTKEEQEENVLTNIDYFGIESESKARERFQFCLAQKNSSSSSSSSNSSSVEERAEVDDEDV
jgi:hypothetical protein